MAIAPSNNKYYCTQLLLGTLFSELNDGGNNWTDITGLPVLNAGIALYIAVSNRDPTSCMVTFTSYSNGEKVYSVLMVGLN